MSYNPKRLEKTEPSQQSRYAPLRPGAGTTRADVNRRWGTRSSVPAGDRRTTPHGFFINLFEAEAFVTRYEVMGPRNNTGRAVNAEGDRMIYVARGMLYVTTFDEQNQPVMVKLHEGMYFNAARGTHFAMATDGTDNVELLIMESKDYAATLEQLEAPTFGQEPNVPQTLQATLLGGPRTSDPQSQRQAQEMAEAQLERRRRAAAAGDPAPTPINANSAAVVGVNPRPSIPRED